MLWYSNASFIFDFIVFVPVKDSMLIWKNLTIYWWLAHRTFILQGCDASKCCPPSFAKNGNGQLPFNRWRHLVVMFNCLTFAHLLQIFLNNIFNQVGWQQQSNEPHWYSSAPFFCIDQLRHAWSTGLSPEEWPPFSGTKLLWPTLSAGSKAKRTWFGTFAGFGWASSGVLLLS